MSYYMGHYVTIEHLLYSRREPTWGTQTYCVPLTLTGRLRMEYIAVRPLKQNKKHITTIIYDKTCTSVWK